VNTWSLSWNGLRTVVELELKQRIRSRRWIWALAGWFVFIGAVTGLMILATNQLFDVGQDRSDNAGPITFAIITFFILGMGLLIAPTFTATSINGDRNAGTLAILQATQLSAVEIATGKLVAAWLTSAVFLVVALPFLAWSMILGNISVLQVLVCFAVVFAEVAVVCAIGLGWSAVISRPAGSNGLTYFSVVGLSAILPGIMALLIPLVQGTTVVHVWGLGEADRMAYQTEVDRYWEQNPDGDGSGAPAAPIGKCAWHDELEVVQHTDRIWWITLPNPFVIVSDAAPLPPKNADGDGYARATSPLGAISYGVRWLSQPPQTERDECVELYASSPAYQVEYDSAGNPTVTTSSGTPVNVESPVKRRTVDTSQPIWPLGLGANVLIGAAFFWIAVRRLRIPYGVLTKGTRVA
jgi:ABC-type transport system involved in multi-copper enzyme maturation permease subunit